MAGSAVYTAILDACVLYPAPLRDLLLSLAADGMFRGRWTRDIHEEWTRNVLRARPDLDPAKLAATVRYMDAAVEDCLIENYQSLIPALDLPDPGDRHVLAAAIAGHADAIVTFNLRDFPKAVIQTHGIEALHPDDFLIAQWDLEPIRMLTVVKALRARLRKPPKTAEELVATYEAQGLPQFAQRLGKAASLI